MSHPYEFFAELSQDMDAQKSDIPTRARVLGDRWLNQFWRPELLVDFKRELEAASSLAAKKMQLKLLLSGLTSPPGMPRLWTYDLFGNESKVEIGFAQTAALVGQAIVTLRNPNERAEVIIRAYFGDRDDGAWYKIPDQFEGIRNALSQKVILVMKGLKADESLAYVQRRDDNLAFDATKEKVPKHRYDSWAKMQQSENIGFVSVKDRLFDPSPSAARGGVEDSVARPAEEQARRVGATLLHELSHLFSMDKTDDIEVTRVSDKGIDRALADFSSRNGKGKLKLKSKNGECYGRILCKALALSNAFLAVQNADSLTFFALDAWLLAQGISLEEILKLP